VFPMARAHKPHITVAQAGQPRTSRPRVWRRERRRLSLPAGPPIRWIRNGLSRGRRGAEQNPDSIGNGVLDGESLQSLGRFFVAGGTTQLSSDPAQESFTVDTKL
jgi:hypothetical protein